MNTSEPKGHSPLAEKTLSRYFLWALLIFVVVGVTFAYVWTTVNEKSASKLPQYGAVPEFSLTTQNDTPIALADFRGSVWIADFIFTNCGASCPGMTMDMEKLQQRLKEQHNIRLVSFSVDPGRDTPEALLEYAHEHHAIAGKWFFLTGEKEKIYSLTQNGFHLSVADAQPGDDPVMHSTKFVLVDKNGVIRGYYDSDPPENLDKLVHDANELAAER